MDSFQPQYFHSDLNTQLQNITNCEIQAVDNPRTFLELEHDKKFVVIHLPNQVQHRFPLPTKEEISKDYSYSESSKKKWINSFMIFRTYLQKSNNYLGLGEISTVASLAWNYATEGVKNACTELETELKEMFKHKRFIAWNNTRKKKDLKRINKTKKRPKKPPIEFYPSPSTFASPSPEMSPYPTICSFLYTPISTPASPMCLSGTQYAMPSLTLPPAIHEENQILDPNSSIESIPTSPLTPSQIFLYPNFFNPSSLGSGLTIPCGLTTPSSNPQDSLLDNPGFGFIDHDLEKAIPETGVFSTETLRSTLISPEDEKNCINELFAGQINEMGSMGSSLLTFE